DLGMAVLRVGSSWVACVAPPRWTNCARARVLNPVDPVPPVPIRGHIHAADGRRARQPDLSRSLRRIQLGRRRRRPSEATYDRRAQLCRLLLSPHVAKAAARKNGEPAIGAA